MILGALNGYFLKVERGNARLHGLPQAIQHIPHNQPGAMHRLKFRSGFTNNHLFCASNSRTLLVTAAGAAMPFTSWRTP